MAASLIQTSPLPLSSPPISGVFPLPDVSSSLALLPGPSPSSSSARRLPRSSLSRRPRLGAPAPPAKLSKRLFTQIFGQLQFADGAARETYNEKQAERFSSMESATSPEADLPDLTSLVADPEFLRTAPLNSRTGQPKVVLPPRMCTLRAFGKSGEGVIRTDSETMSAFFNSLTACIEFKANIQAWEILSGRLAMMVFASAVAVEALTGNTMFQKMDIQGITEFAAAGIVAMLGAAIFAFAWRAKARVFYTMSKGCENLLNGVIDNLVDNLFFEEDDS